MPRFAQTAEIQAQGGGRYRLLIDGEEFPWYLAAGRVRIEHGGDDSGGITEVNITLMVEGEVKIPGVIEGGSG